MAGDERSGVTIMRVTEELDAGPVALQEEIAVSARRRLRIALGPARRARRRAPGPRARSASTQGSLEFTEQDDSLATYAEKIRPEERRLDPDRPGGRAGADGARAQPADRHPSRARRRGVARGAGGAGAFPGDRRGVRSTVEDGRLLLGCAEGGLRLERVQPPGRRPMAAAELLAGARPPPSARVAAATIATVADRPVAWLSEATAASGRRTLPRRRRAPFGVQTAPAAASRGCAPRSFPGRFVCVNCLRRFELVSQCPNCGEHQTISRMSRTEDMKCQHCSSLDASLDLTLEAATDTASTGRRELYESKRVAPSILSADFSRLGSQVEEVIAAGARRDPRRRHGRPLRPADHDRSAGRRARSRTRSTTPAERSTST